MATTSAIAAAPAASSAGPGKPTAVTKGFDALLGPLTAGLADDPARMPAAPRAAAQAAPRRNTEVNAAPAPHNGAPKAGNTRGEKAADEVTAGQTLAAPLQAAAMMQPGAHNPSGPAPESEVQPGKLREGTSKPRPEQAGAQNELPQQAADVHNASAGPVQPGLPQGSSADPSTRPDDASSEEPGTRRIAMAKGARAHKAEADKSVASGNGAAFAGTITDHGSDAGTPSSPISLPDPDQVSAAASPGDQKAAASQEAAAPTVDVSAPAPPPSAQLGHALAAVHTAADGSSQVRILLNPAELGSIQIRIVRAHDGSSSVSVAVERPETLRSLQGDLGHLHQALDRAGLPEQRSLVVHLAGSDAPPPASAGGQNGFADRGAAQGGSQQNARRDSPAPQSGAPAIDSSEAGRTQSGAAAAWQAAPWQRAGVNITA